MKAALILLVFVFLGIPSSLLAWQTSIRARQFMAKSYVRETVFEFQKGSKYPIVNATPEGYYVQIHDGHDLVVLLEGDAAALPVRLKGNELLFWETHRFESDRAYLVFPPENWYRVVEEVEGKYKIEYVLGNTKLHCSVLEEEFVKAKHILGVEGRLIDRHAVKPQDAVCVLQFSSGISGTGFLLYEGGAFYCYTNHHVAMNVGRLRISLVDGSELKFGQVEIAEDVDLARFRLFSELPGFDGTASPTLQDKVRVMGNSFGSGRITSLEGQVTGLNATEIETSVKFVGGNSGSPIINEAGDVIGVAAWVEYFPDEKNIASGSDFKDGRRVGVRLDREIEWVPVEIGQYVSSNRLILQTVDFLDELPHAMALFFRSDLELASLAQEFKDPVLRQWIRSRLTRFKAFEKAFQSKVEAGTAQQGKRFVYTPSYAALEKGYVDKVVKESETFWNSLRQKIVSKKRSLERAIGYPDTSYMRGEIQRILDRLEAALHAVSVVQEMHREYLHRQ